MAKLVNTASAFFLFFLVLSPLFAFESDPSLNDGKARIYSVRGHAVIAKKGNPIEKKLKAGDEIAAGDTVTCGEGTSVSIQFDHELKNAVRIPAGSRVVFESVEPTVIHIEDGSVFSVVDGLAEGGIWKVTSPAAVAAVRGTVYIVRYGISNGDFFTATVNVPDDGKNSAIEISSLTSSGSVRVAEGKSLTLNKRLNLKDAVTQDLDPSAVKEVLDFYAEVVSERPADEEESGRAETVAEFTEKTCDAAGQNCSVQTCKMTENGKICSYE